MTSPRAPIQSPRFSFTNSSKRSVTAARANSCTAPDASRSSPKAAFPWLRSSMRRPATPTVTPDSSPGSSADQVPTMSAVWWVRSKRYGMSRGDASPVLGGSSRGRLAHEGTLRSYTMRRPCRVNQGSTCSMVSEYGAMSELNPPVATTVAGPSSSMKRRASESTRPAKP